MRSGRSPRSPGDPAEIAECFRFRIHGSQDGDGSAALLPIADLAVGFRPLPGPVLVGGGDHRSQRGVDVIDPRRGLDLDAFPLGDIEIGDLDVLGLGARDDRGHAAGFQVVTVDGVDRGHP